MVKYWFLSGQGLPAKGRSFVGVIQETLCSGPTQSFWQDRSTKEKKHIKDGEWKKIGPAKGCSACNHNGSKVRRTEKRTYLFYRLQLIWILMMCLWSGNAQQITADRITVRVPWTQNEDLEERVYILFKWLSTEARERDSGNVLCYNSVVVPPSRSDNRLANGKPSITIRLLFHQCLCSTRLCEMELE